MNTAPAPVKPVTRKKLKGAAMSKPGKRPAQNYYGAYHKKRNKANHAFRVPAIGGDFGA